MSFAVDNLADSFNRINFNSPHQAWLAGKIVRLYASMLLIDLIL
jgi:hypothetical protein